MTAKLDIGNLAVPTDTSPDGVLARQPAKADAVKKVALGQDRVLGGGRRILLRYGLLGSSEFQVPQNTDPDGGPSQQYPTGETRTIARALHNLTPGHALRLVALVLPSGPRQAPDLGGWIKAGAGGSITLEVTWRHGGSTFATSTTIQTPTSALEFNGEPQGDGEGFDAIAQVESGLIRVMSADFADDVAEIWHGTAVTVELALRFTGSVRPVDVIVHEEPWRYAADEALDTVWPTGCFADGDGEPLDEYPTPWPIFERNSSDRTRGTRMIADVGNDQCDVLGPAFFQFSSHVEHITPVNALEEPPLALQNTTYESLIDDALVVDWDADNAGWSLASAGAHARVFVQSGRLLQLRDVNGAVPLRVRVLARRSGAAGTAWIKIQSHRWGWREINFSDDTWDWREVTVWARCGVGPWDPSSVQIFGRVSGAGQTLEVRAIAVCFGEG